MHDMNLSLSPRLDTAGPAPVTDTSIHLKTLMDEDQVKIMDN